MPGLITHYLGGQSALRAIDHKIRIYIAPCARLFNLGTQGPDIFFYYPTGFITKRIRGIGSTMHESDLGQFFMHMADAIKETASPSKRKFLFAYTAGALAHYAMDVRTHSYVYGMTHLPQESGLKESGLKESSRHRHFETSIDILMLRRLRDKQPADFKLAELITPEEIQRRTAAAAVSDAIRDIYNANIHPWDVYQAMGRMASNTNILQSKSGKRKTLLGALERLTMGSKIISALIHTQKVSDGVDYLNLDKTSWSAPWSPDMQRNESFVELFESAVSDTATMIDALHSYTQSRITRDELAGIIDNRSLKTGYGENEPAAKPI